MEIDTTKPNAGRIYDYLLGGSHNFEADRQAAERLVAIAPSIRNGMRLNRWFLHDVVQRLTNSDFDCFLDLATGLPSEGYIHDLVPQARVLYSDHDPVTVAYGQQIMGDNEHVQYMLADITQIDPILEAADEHFQGQRRIAVCFVGGVYFIDDQQARYVIEQLYNWCAPGSQMAMSWLVVPDPTRPKAQQLFNLYRAIGTPMMSRTPDEVTSLLAPWQIMEPGLLPLHTWLELDDWLEAEDIDEQGGMYGVIVRKPDTT